MVFVYFIFIIFVKIKRSKKKNVIFTKKIMKHIYFSRPLGEILKLRGATTWVQPQMTPLQQQ